MLTKNAARRIAINMRCCRGYRKFRRAHHVNPSTLGPGKSGLSATFHLALHSGGTEEQTKWFNDLQRITTSPENAARLRQVVDDIEVTALLPKVTAPTLEQVPA
jgi:hypothetical protein